MSTSMLTSPIELLRKDIEEAGLIDSYSDEFYQELLDYGIESVEQFEDAFNGVYDSGADFAEQLCDDCGYLHCAKHNEEIPAFILTHIDWEAVWSRELCFDYFMIKANTGYAFFSMHF